MDQERENIAMHVLSGKYLVAGELLRQHMAAIIIGNKCDVIVRNGRIVIPVQVATERDAKWTIDYNPAEPENSIWVLVHLSRENSAPSEFFVLTDAELKAIVKPKHDAFLTAMKGRLYRRAGRPYGKCSVSREEVEDNKDAWSKVRKALGRPR